MSGAANALRVRMRFTCGDRFALGPGKADLLAAIEAERSITAAAKAMDMSYRRAWLLVDEMNRCFAERLVETLSGGGKERGARLTEAGRAVLAAFRALEGEAGRLVETAPAGVITALLRDAPLPAED